MFRSVAIVLVHFTWLHHPHLIIWWLLHTIAVSLPWGQSTCSAAAVALMECQVQPVIFSGHTKRWHSYGELVPRFQFRQQKFPGLFDTFYGCDTDTVWCLILYDFVLVLLKSCRPASLQRLQCLVPQHIHRVAWAVLCSRLALSQRAPYWCVGTASLLQGFRCLLLCLRGVLTFGFSMFFVWPPRCAEVIFHEASGAVLGSNRSAWQRLQSRPTVGQQMVGHGWTIGWCI